MSRRNESVGEILLKSPWWISAVLQLPSAWTLAPAPLAG